MGKGTLSLCCHSVHVAKEVLTRLKICASVGKSCFVLFPNNFSVIGAYHDLRDLALLQRVLSPSIHVIKSAISLTETSSARFIRAVSELELLGFIKPSKQKTDHVARLTWGGC